MTTSRDFASLLHCELEAVHGKLNIAYSLLVRSNLTKERGIADTAPELVEAIERELSELSGFLTYASVNNTLQQISNLKAQVAPVSALVRRIISNLNAGVAIATGKWHRKMAESAVSEALETYRSFEALTEKANKNTALMQQHYCLLYAVAHKVAAFDLAELKAWRDDYVLEPSNVHLADYIATAEPIEELVTELKIDSEHMELALKAQEVTAFRIELFSKLQVAELVSMVD